MKGADSSKHKAQPRTQQAQRRSSSVSLTAACVASPKKRTRKKTRNLLYAKPMRRKRPSSFRFPLSIRQGCRASQSACSRTGCLAAPPPGQRRRSVCVFWETLTKRGHAEEVKGPSPMCPLGGTAVGKALRERGTQGLTADRPTPHTLCTRD